MSLDWSYGKIARKDEDGVLYEAKDPETGEQPMTAQFNAAIWNMMAIGLGSLTDKNIAEAMARTKMREEMGGACMSKGEADGRGGVKIVDVYLWPRLPLFIGLSTNVSTESRTAWLARMFKKELQDVEKELKKEAAA